MSDNVASFSNQFDYPPPSNDGEATNSQSPQMKKSGLGHAFPHWLRLAGNTPTHP